MTTRIVGPFGRVEGDLEVQLDCDGDRVRAARVVSPLYRGFEQILRGKAPGDALVYAPRICGICSVSQSVAAARALADAAGVRPSRNGELAHNLTLATENVADHLTHFYLFFMPDFARPVYAGEPWYGTTAERFRAVEGSAARDFLPARAGFLQLMGILAGKWPHSLALQPGGSTRAIAAEERARMAAKLHALRRFLERWLFGDALEAVAALDARAALAAWAAAPGGGDLRHFLELADALELHRLGRAGDRFMSYGAYPIDDTPLFARGVWDDGPRPLDPAAITEDPSHGWLGGSREPRHPYDGVTLPDADAADGYSWCKAPRLDGAVVEVGALARQQVDGQPLIRELVAESGGNVRNRVVARLLEVARVVIAMQGWLAELEPGAPFCAPFALPDEARGAGLVEAARGSLGHWLRVKNGRILNYQIVAPTTWNFSPRDREGVPGPLEQALAGAPIRPGEEEPVAVQHIVRSFDPCMVCTVH
ncbi:nickel-dependent hydrogenase large subunit [Endothiovibrio diazotrophicus]